MLQKAECICGAQIHRVVAGGIETWVSWANGRGESRCYPDAEEADATALHEPYFPRVSVSSRSTAGEN